MTNWLRLMYQTTVVSAGLIVCLLTLPTTLLTPAHETDPMADSLQKFAQLYNAVPRHTLDASINPGAEASAISITLTSNKQLIRSIENNDLKSLSLPSISVPTVLFPSADAPNLRFKQLSPRIHPDTQVKTVVPSDCVPSNFPSSATSDYDRLMVDYFRCPAITGYPSDPVRDNAGIQYHRVTDWSAQPVDTYAQIH